MPDSPRDHDPDHEKHQDVAHAARSGGMQVLTVAAGALLSVTHVLLARLFGRAVFGSYQASLAILDLVTRGGTGGAGGGLLRYVAAHRARGEEDQVRSAIGTGLRLCLLMSGAAAALLVATAGPLAGLMREPALQTALRIMAPAAIATGCMLVLVQASLSAKVTRANFYVRGLGEPVFLLLAGLSAALVGRSLATLAVAHVVAATATLLLAIVAVGRVFGRGELGRALRAPRMPGFIPFSLPLAVGDVLNGVLQRADIILLTMFVGTSAAGVYAASEFITRIIASARSVFDSVAAPVFAEAVSLGQRDRLKQNLVMMNRWVVTVSAPMALTVVVLRRDLLALYGSAFQEGATTVAILAVSHWVNVSFGLMGWIVVGGGRCGSAAEQHRRRRGQHRARRDADPRFGLLGAALAALGSVVLLHLQVLVEVRLWFGIYPFDRTILKPLAAAAATLAVEVALDSHVAPAGLRIPLVIVAGLLAYVTTLGVLGLAPEEARLVAGAREEAARRGRERRPLEMLSIPLLNQIRSAEIEAIAKRFPPGARVLEIGVGRGSRRWSCASAGSTWRPSTSPARTTKGISCSPSPSTTAGTSRSRTPASTSCSPPMSSSTCGISPGFMPTSGGSCVPARAAFTCSPLMPGASGRCWPHSRRACRRRRWRSASGSAGAAGWSGWGRR